MASIISVLNMKGGSGKSTIATNLARGLQQHGSVCIVDADPQGTALRWDNADPEGRKAGHGFDTNALSGSLIPVIKFTV